MSGFVFDINKLDETLFALQNSGINRSSVWEARVFEKSELDDNALSVLKRVFKSNPKYDNLSKYKEYAEKGGWNGEAYRMTANLELISLPDWDSYLEQRIEYWSNFELISKESKLRFNHELFTENKRKFKDELYKSLAIRKLLKVYKINELKFDTYHLWGAQIFEDFVFELANEIVTISFGWSS